MKRGALALCTSLLILASAPGLALANTSTLDQSSAGADDSTSSAYLYAQTFTAGAYGTLDYVDLYLSATSATVTVSLQGTTGNPPVPDGVIHGQRVRGVTTVGPQWVEFDFFSNYVVIPGHVYALFIFPTDNAALYGSAASDYSRGQALIYHGGTWSPDATFVPGAPADFAFKTFVGLAPATPTPTHAPTAPPAPRATATSAPAIASASGSDSASGAVTAPSTAAVAGATGSGPGSSGAPNAQPGSQQSGSQSGGSGDMTIPIIAALILVLILLVGAGGFLLMRRRQASS